MSNYTTVYTEDLHIEGLKLLLSQEDPCSRCPKHLIGKKLEMNFFTYYCNSLPCNICKNFIGIYDNSYYGIYNDSHYNCPCYILEKEEAIKRTWIKLEEVLDENDPFLNDERYNYDK